MQGTDTQFTSSRVLAGAAPVALVFASLVDVAGAAGALPDGWPVASYALVGAAVAMATATVLVRVLRTRTGEHTRRWLTLLELAATGLLLGSWLLRGHHEIPPDPPLVGAQLLVVVLLGAAAFRRWRG